MRYLFGFLCVCALGVMPLAGCSETTGNGTRECESLRDCDDQDVCTFESCVDGVCEYSPVCDDGNDCTEYRCTPTDDWLVCSDPIPVADGTACAGGTCLDGVCQLTGSVLPCTEQGIRNAISAGGGPYTFDCDGPTTLAARFAIDNDVILDGGGQLIVDAFDVQSGVRAELRAFEMTDQFVWADRNGISNSGTLEITNSSVWGFSGGGIYNGGTLVLRNSSVSGNWHSGITNSGTLTITSSTISGNATGTNGIVVAGGAGIFNSGTLTITDSTVSENGDFSGNGGGGIHNDGGLVTLTNSSVSGNKAQKGGGIFNTGTLTITNSTISGNDERQQLSLTTGGANFNTVTLKITSSKVSGNTADEGSGIHNDGTARLTNSLIDGDCVGDITSSGYNIESPGNTCGFDQSTDTPAMSAEELKLGQLADNGGPTKTNALEPGSVAIDHIPVVDCGLTTDQRGEPRPETGGTMCDVGAFEVQP